MITLTDADLCNHYGDKWSAKQEIYDYFFVCPSCKWEWVHGLQHKFCANCGNPITWNLTPGELYE